jgi:hypothetical protein
MESRVQGRTGWFTLAAVAACLSMAVVAALAAGLPDVAGQTISRDEQNIYEAVLNSWLDRAYGRQFVSTDLGPAPSKSDPDFGECAQGRRFSTGALNPTSHKSLTGVQFKRPGVELVDLSQWNPLDPGQAIAEGKSVDTAVDQGIAHSLISFSQVTFSDDRKDALVKFSMVCGRLCGTGRTMRLHNSGGHWAVAEPCGESWIS